MEHSLFFCRVYSVSPWTANDIPKTDTLRTSKMPARSRFCVALRDFFVPAGVLLCVSPNQQYLRRAVELMAHTRVLAMNAYTPCVGSHIAILMYTALSR